MRLGRRVCEEKHGGYLVNLLHIAWRSGLGLPHL